jgi:N6-adenosine-specific RNA methylase IME4
MKININEIKIGKRLREIDNQKVGEIAESIKQIGLINPVTLDNNNNLLAGLHRLEAYKQLGYKTIDYIVCNQEGLYAELVQIDENLIRADLHYTDRAVFLARRKEIYEELYPETKAISKGGKFKGNRYKKVVKETVSFTKNTARKTGLTDRTIRHDIQIAEAFNPTDLEILKDKDISKKDALKTARLEEQKKGKVVKLYESGEAKNFHEAIRIISKQDKISVPLPDDKFDLVLADPPWEYDFAETENRAIENHYPTMKLKEIKSLKVPISDNAVLFLWATAPKLLEALEVMKSWNFVYKTNAVWDKEIIGSGYWFRGQHELLLVGVRGNYSPPFPENRFSSVIRSKRTKHSKKPEIVYEILEKMFPDSKKLELFAREKRKGWTAWGNEGNGVYILRCERCDLLFGGNIIQIKRKQINGFTFCIPCSMALEKRSGKFILLCHFCLSVGKKLKYSKKIDKICCEKENCRSQFIAEIMLKMSE